MAVYLTRTPSSAGNRKKFTMSVWAKICSDATMDFIGVGGVYDQNHIQIEGNRFMMRHYVSGGNDIEVNTNALIRDFNAWYHFVCAVDTTQSTASNRIKLYINGELQTLNSSTYPSQNYDWDINDTVAQYIGRRGHSSAYLFNGIMSHFYFCDGYQYTPSEFGETDSTTGEWKIKVDGVNVNYGTNGFLIFKDGNNLSGSTVQDQSGNGNDWTVYDGTLSNTKDSPSNNFATINRLSTEQTLESGNNYCLYTSGGSGYQTASSTLAMTSGKYYCEVKTNVVSGNYPGVGIAKVNVNATTNPVTSDWLGQDDDSYGLYVGNGYLYYNNSNTQTASSTFANGDILGMALDLDSATKTLKYYKNGSLILTVNIATWEEGYHFAHTFTSSESGAEVSWNFGNGVFKNSAVTSEGTNASGNGVFEYDVPTGYTALSTRGLNT